MSFLEVAFSAPGWLVALILIGVVIFLWLIFCFEVILPLMRKYVDPVIWRLVGGQGTPPDHDPYGEER